MAAFDGDEVEFVILEEGVALATFIVPASMTLASLRKEIHMDSAEICELPQSSFIDKLIFLPVFYTPSETIISFLFLCNIDFISPIALFGLRPFGQTFTQFMIP